MSDYIVGRNSVLEALNNDTQIDKLFIQKGELKGSIKKIIGKAKDKKIVITEVNRNRLDELSEGLPHQGVAALVGNFNYSSIEDILNTAKSREEDPFVIILDELEDPHNLGAIIRTAEVAGAHGIIIPKRRSASITAVVHKASAGATNYMKVAMVTNINQTIEKLKKENIFVYGACGEATEFYNKTNLTGPIALVIGNEGKGISQSVKKNCDALIKIPMFGKINSLNASNAAAVLIYEVVRQRNDG